MKKLLSGVLTIVMFVTLSSTAFAAESNTNPYQEVIDKLNAEYGTSAQLPSEEKVKNLGNSDTYLSVSIEEFENSIRQDIEANLNAQAEADAMMDARKDDEVIAGGSGVCSVPVGNPKATYTVNRSKDVPGATVHLEATVSNNNGYWTYSSVSSVHTTYTAGVNSSPAFGADTFNYSYLDARRTCAVKLYGYTMGDWGVIIDNNAYRYVEFWAGNGM